jgi:MFS family permease
MVGPQRNAVAVLSLAAFIASVNVFLIYIPLVDIGQHLGQPTIKNLVWVINGYAIAFGVSLAPFKRLTAMYQRKAMFQLGAAIFTTASVGCAISNSLSTLVGFRVFQAIGAALLTATSGWILVKAIPQSHVTDAIRTWTASSACGMLAGPVIGGLLPIITWRLVFLVNVVFGVIAFVGGLKYVPRFREETAEGVSHAARFELLGRSSFAWMNIGVLVFVTAFAANLLGVVLWMRQVSSYSALRAGVAIVPGVLFVFAGTTLSHAMRRHLGLGRTAAVGCALSAAGSVVILFSVREYPDFLRQLLPGSILLGTSVGLSLPTIFAVTMVGLRASQLPIARSVLTMSQQAGSVLGVSVVVALLGHSAGITRRDGFERVWAATAALSLVASVLSLRMSPGWPLSREEIHANDAVIASAVTVRVTLVNKLPDRDRDVRAVVRREPGDAGRPLILLARETATAGDLERAFRGAIALYDRYGPAADAPASVRLWRDPSESRNPYRYRGRTIDSPVALSVTEWW